MKIQNIQGIIFDLDGTLYTLKWLKVRMFFAVTGSLYFLSSLYFLKKLSKVRNSMRHIEYADKQELLTAFYDKLAVVTKRSPQQVSKWYQSVFLDQFVLLLATKAKAREGLVDLLVNLKQKKIKIAVVSDFGRVKERLKALNLDLGLFDDIAATEDFGVLKPLPKPMTVLARKWKLDPQQIVIVGDREDLDKKCALAAGMQFLGVTEKECPEKTDFSNWNNVLKMLKTNTKNAE